MDCNPVIKYMEYAKLLSLCDVLLSSCACSRAYIFISIKGVQNALKCIKQIEIYYHLNANVNVCGVQYAVHGRQDPAKCLIYANTEVVGMNKPPPIHFYSVFFFPIFSALLSLCNTNRMFATPIFFFFCI